MLRGEAIWQTISIGPMSMPSSSDAVATSARSSPARSCDSTRWRRSSRQAAVVRGDRVVAEPLGEQMRDALGHAPRVDEHERGAVRADVRGDGVEHLAELLARRHRLELTRRQLDGDVERAPVADVDDGAARAAVGVAARRPRADEQPGDSLDRDAASPTARCAPGAARTAARGARA